MRHVHQHEHRGRTGASLVARTSVHSVRRRRWHAARVQWSPPAGPAVALALLGIALGAGSLTLDPAGRVLVGGAAVLLLVLAARDLLVRPRLAAEPEGLVVRRLSGRKLLPWSRVRVRVRTTRRLGVQGRSLELDTAPGPQDDGVLVLLGRWDLGAAPDDVARTLHALRPPGR